MVRSLLLLVPVLALVEERGTLFRKIARKEPHNVAQAIAGMGLDWDMNRIGNKSLLNNATVDDAKNVTFKNGESAVSPEWDADNSSSNQPTAAEMAAADAASAAARHRKLLLKSAASSENRTQLKTAPGHVVSSPELKINASHEVHGSMAAHAAAKSSHLITPHAMVAPGHELHRGVVIIVETLNINGTRIRARRAPAVQYSLSEACRAEMNALTTNATKAQKASLCERKANFTAKAIAALEAGDSHGAVHSVEAAFMRCSQMDPQCGRDIATQVVQKLRVSGMAIDKRCRAVQENVSNQEFSDADIECMETTAKHVVTALKASNSSDMGFEVAIRYGQEGLHKCQNVQAPCDFQIAPFAVKDIVENFMEEDEESKMEASLAQFYAAGQDIAATLAAKGSLLQEAA